MKTRMLTLTLALCLLLTLLPAAALAGNGNTEFPQVVTAYMKINYSCGCKATGTGGMIRPDGLITAGHNLICKNHNKPAKAIEFYFGYVSPNDYWYKYTGKYTSYTFCDFSNGYTTENDIGLVKFPKRIGDYMGWYGWDLKDASELEGEKVFVVTHHSDGKSIIYQGVLSKYDENRVSFEHSALPAGADGAPIYFFRGAARNPALIAVYSGCVGNSCIGSIINLDVAMKIVDEMAGNSEK